MVAPDAAAAPVSPQAFASRMTAQLAATAAALGPETVAEARALLDDDAVSPGSLAALLATSLLIVRGSGAASRLPVEAGALAELMPLRGVGLSIWLGGLQRRATAEPLLAGAVVDLLSAAAKAEAPDPFLAFDALLAAADPATARRHGAYYTPWPLAHFMVARLDRACTDAGLGGLAGALASGVVVDPALGTGVFLAALVAHLHRSGVDPDALEGFVGFELMGSARALCRQLVAGQLRGLGWPATGAVDLSLRAADFPALVASGAPVAGGRPVVAVVGNPPYRRGRLPGAVRALCAPYREGLEGERNLQPLSDAYIAFVRAAEQCLAGRRRGAMCLVTNHAFLRGRLHRAMRRHLLARFDAIEVLDLHGSVRVRDGAFARDEGVFPIHQGVCVTTCTLAGDGARGRGPATLDYASLRGLRADKLGRLARAELPTPGRLQPGPPLHPWAPVEAVPVEYGGFVPLTDLFSFHAVAGKPGDDRTLVAFDGPTLLTQLRSRRAALAAGEGAGSEAARKLAARPVAEGFESERVAPYAYRPFDERVVYDEPELWTRPPRRLRSAMAGGPVLLTTRIVKDPRFDHVWLTAALPDVISLSSTSSVNAYGFPVAALRPEVLAEGLRRPLSVDAALGYIYAVLHSEHYRTRYLGGLRDDFPRIPLARETPLVDTLVAVGDALCQLHLGPARPSIAGVAFVDGGDRKLRRIGAPGKLLAGLRDGRGELAINGRSHFTGVPARVFAARVGAYQVAHKWLDDRRRAGRDLTPADEAAYLELLGRLEATLHLRERVDAAIDDAGGFPGAFR